MRDPVNVIERFAFQSTAAGATAAMFGADAAMVPEAGISGSNTYYVARIQLSECFTWRLIQPVIKLTDNASGDLFLICVPRGTSDADLARTALGDLSIPGQDVSCSARVSLRAQVTPSEASVVESWGLIVPDGSRGLAWDIALIWQHETATPAGAYVAVQAVRGGAL